MTIAAVMGSLYKAPQAAGLSMEKLLKTYMTKSVKSTNTMVLIIVLFCFSFISNNYLLTNQKTDELKYAIAKIQQILQLQWRFVQNSDCLLCHFNPFIVSLFDFVKFSSQTHQVFSMAQ